MIKFKFPKLNLKKENNFFKNEQYVFCGSYILHEKLYRKIKAFKEVEYLKDGNYSFGIWNANITFPNYKKLLEIGKLNNEYKISDTIYFDEKRKEHCLKLLSFEEGNKVTCNTLLVNFKFYEILKNVEKFIESKKGILDLYINNEIVGIIACMKKGRKQ